MKYYVYGLKSWKLQFNIIKKQDMGVYGKIFIEVKTDEHGNELSYNLLKTGEIYCEIDSRLVDCEYGKKLLPQLIPKESYSYNRPTTPPPEGRPIHKNKRYE